MDTVKQTSDAKTQQYTHHQLKRTEGSGKQQKCPSQTNSPLYPANPASLPTTTTKYQSKSTQSERISTPPSPTAATKPVNLNISSPTPSTSAAIPSSASAVQSNHTRQVAAAAAHVGLRTRSTGSTGSTRAMRRPVSASSISPPRWGWWRSVETVIVCAVTGSTVAGMVAGFKLIEKLYPEEEAKKGAHGGKRRKVVGIDASAKPAETRAQVLRIAKDTAEKIGLGAEQITEEDIVLDERYHAGVYGIPDKQTWDMVRRGKISSGQRQLVVYNPRW
ncbi:ACC deaminase [Blastomyces gilchristii SLH14081]|uniref:ACC deaminase n=1 Tax=Blastomyces gilchristii (strain SLH14081) TaxID=559298 RepID=A0A179UN76_BLAGS|nr:ACC deaminase [Blastomyces gilchristii SLH14081]OAT08481.1 ACC deaminase [Blastomyces gilchristii SLH14081]